MIANLALLLGATGGVDDLEQIRSALTGDFLDVEMNGPGEGRGHIVARLLPGGFLARDYWTIARDKRIYAGHDVLLMQKDGTAYLWWFGSRGEFAMAEGRWTSDSLVLVVYEGESPERRYTYRFPEGKAFRYTNERFSSGKWMHRVDSAWERGAPRARPSSDRRPRRSWARSPRRESIAPGSRSRCA